LITTIQVVQPTPFCSRLPNLQIFNRYPPTTNERRKIAAGSVFNQREFVYAPPSAGTVAIELDWARKTGYDKTKIQY
jgi:hypothetical protein